MPYAVEYNKEEQLIELTLKGTINLLDVTKMASEIAAITKKHNCYRILNDARESVIELSVMEIYDLPRVVSEILSEEGLPIAKFKRAIVVPQKIDDFHFFETVSRNRSQNVMLFRDFNEAKNWLIHS